MPKPFDAATKRLVEVHPQDWLGYLGLGGISARLIEADLTTVTAEADKVLLVEDEVGASYLAHVEFQSTYETDMDERVLRYNTLLFCRHRLPVQSVLVLLRREAGGPEVAGIRAGGRSGDAPPRSAGRCFLPGCPARSDPAHGGAY